MVKPVIASAAPVIASAAPVIASAAKQSVRSSPPPPELTTKISDLSLHPQWLKILQYIYTKKKYISRLKDPNAFLSKTGSENPADELQEMILQLQDSNALTPLAKQHPACAFPARTRFIREHLPEISIANIFCDDFMEWRQGLAAKNISIVFSSAYAGSPASLFGHTFLKIGKGKKSEELLDYGINFAAMPDMSDNAFAYAVKGLTGGYLGEFGILPYYMKVTEYNNSEARDLWEYELNLSNLEIDRLMEYIWEMYEVGKIPYYFFNENCSYQILYLLEIAKPEWELTKHPDFFIKPQETIKQLAKIDSAVKSINYRASNRLSLENKISKLSAAELKNLQSYLKNFAQQEIESPQLAAAEVDSALDYINMKKHKDSKKELSAQEKNNFFRLLRARAQLESKIAVSTEITKPREQPDLSHDPRDVNIIYKPQHLGINFRMGYHNFLDNDRGYYPHLSVNYFDFSILRNLKNKSDRLEYFRLLEITTLDAFKWFDPKISWSLDIKYHHTNLFDCDDEGITSIEGEAGASHTFLNKIKFYHLFGVFAARGGNCMSAYWLAQKSRIGFLLFFQDSPIKINLEWNPYISKLQADYLVDHIYKAEMQIHPTNALHLGFNYTQIKQSRTRYYIKQWQSSVGYRF